MFLSLVVCTVDRTEALSRLFASLSSQSTKDFEIIVVDQNLDDRVAAVVEEWATHGLEITRVRSERGLSRSRNKGLLLAKGQYVGFPDDDCSYPSELVASLSALLRANPNWAGLSGMTVSFDGSSTCGRWSPKNAKMSRGRVWNQGNSASIFLRRDVIEEVGPFDETLGLGAASRWLSGEETDYLIRALDLGYHIQYCPEIRIFHPKPAYGIPSSALRARTGGRGMGRVLRKQKFGIVFLAKICFRPLAGAVLKSVTGQWSYARFYLQSLLGRLEGYLSTEQC